jgi:DNA-directed RNA polymerase II subunit RPB1
MARSTFHLSGTGNKTVTSGIPRLKEVINVSKNIKTPSMTIHLLPPYNLSKKDAERIKVQLQHATLEAIVSECQVIHDPDYKDSLCADDRAWMDIQTSYPDEDAPEATDLYPWVMRMSFSRKELYIRDLTMAAVADKITDIFDEELFVMHTDDNNKELTMHIRLYKTHAPPNPPPTGETEADDEITGEVFFNFIKNDFLSAVTVCGVPGIEKTFVSKKQFPTIDPKTGVLASTGKEYVIETDGINMRDCIYVEGVDPYRLTCNDPRDILSLFGVELARETLLYEIRAVTEGGGSYIDYRHLSLLCDVMTHGGQLMAITRHGIRRTDAGPLMKCTFEQTVEILNDAAMRGKADEIQGVAEHVMLGKIAPLGTGIMDMLLDKEMLTKAHIVENDVSQTVPVAPTLHRGRRVMRAESSERAAYCPLRPSYLADRRG